MLKKGCKLKGDEDKTGLVKERLACMQASPCFG